MSALRFPALSSHHKNTHHERGEDVDTPQTPVTERLPRDDVRVSMTRVITAWGFGAVFFNMTAGAIYTAFTRSIGANDFVFGILAGAAPLMGFFQILSARIVEGSGKRKAPMMISGIVGRSLWIVAALIPLIAEYFPHLITKNQILTSFTFLVVVSGAFQAITGPAFFSWMTDLVPSRLRPMFFAKRMQVGTWLALATSIVAGMIADHWPARSTYCILLAISGVFGVLDLVCFFGVREPHPDNIRIEGDKPRRKAVPLMELFRQPLSDVPTRRFLCFIAFLVFSYGIQGPFVWIYAMEYLDLSKTAAGLLLNALPLIGTAISLKFWGDVIRRYGNRPVMRICSTLFALTGIGWLIARPGAWDVLPILIFLSAIMTGGLELANTNMIAGLSPHIPRSSMTAVFAIVAGLSLAAAAWCGGVIAQSLHWVNEGNYTIAGMKLVSYHALFLISIAVRLITATFIAPHLHDAEAAGTVDTVKEVFPELAQSFAARFSRPIGWRGQ